MKILCCCEGGNCRSVCIAKLLKENYKQDALSFGLIRNSPETLLLLCNWADYIFVLAENLLSSIPNQYKEKTVLMNVGPDRWFDSTNQELIDMCASLIKNWGKIG